MSSVTLVVSGVAVSVEEPAERLAELHRVVEVGDTAFVAHDLALEGELARCGLSRAPRRRELVDLAEQAGADQPATLGLTLAGLEATGLRVVAAVDDAGVLLAGQLAAGAARDVAVVMGSRDVGRLMRSVSTSGEWALVAAGGAAVLILHAQGAVPAGS